MKQVILYSMKGCPWCDEMKKQLKENKIKFHNRDIEKHAKEYDMFVELTGNDYVPAFMIVEMKDEEAVGAEMLVPEKDFDEIHEAIEKVQNLIKD